MFNLEEYESAKAAFEAGQALDSKNSSFKTWIRKCNAELDGESHTHSLLESPVLVGVSCVSHNRQAHAAKAWV